MLQQQQQYVELLNSNVNDCINGSFEKAEYVIAEQRQFLEVALKQHRSEWFEIWKVRAQREHQKRLSKDLIEALKQFVTADCHWEGVRAQMQECHAEEPFMVYIDDQGIQRKFDKLLKAAQKMERERQCIRKLQHQYYLSLKDSGIIQKRLLFSEGITLVEIDDKMQELFPKAEFVLNLAKRKRRSVVKRLMREKKERYIQEDISSFGDFVDDLVKDHVLSPQSRWEDDAVQGALWGGISGPSLTMLRHYGVAKDEYNRRLHGLKELQSMSRNLFECMQLNGFVVKDAESLLEALKAMQEGSYDENNSDDSECEPSTAAKQLLDMKIEHVLVLFEEFMPTEPTRNSRKKKKRHRKQQDIEIEPLPKRQRLNTESAQSEQQIDTLNLEPFGDGLNDVGDGLDNVGDGQNDHGESNKDRNHNRRRRKQSKQSKQRKQRKHRKQRKDGAASHYEGNGNLIGGKKRERKTKPMNYERDGDGVCRYIAWPRHHQWGTQDSISDFTQPKEDWLLGISLEKAMEEGRRAVNDGERKKILKKKAKRFRLPQE